MSGKYDEEWQKVERQFFDVYSVSLRVVYTKKLIYFLLFGTTLRMSDFLLKLFVVLNLKNFPKKFQKYEKNDALY